MSRILVVDDSDAIHLLLQHILTERGYEVVTASNAQEAVQAIFKQKPDLILLDVVLPDVGGFQLCELLRKQPATKTIPIIMITGSAITGREKATGLQAGADDYVTKPFEPDELVERIRAILRRTAAAPAPLVSAADTHASGVLPPAWGLETETTVSHSRVPAAVQAMIQALSDPLHLPAELPSVSVLFLLLMMGLAAVSSVVTSDLAAQPLIVCLIAFLLWSVLTTVLVVTGSLAGIALSWKQGARLVSLANLPVLLKVLGGTVLAATTSISPFLYTASPALFVHPAPFWMYRLDLFELWAVALLWMLLKSRPRASAAKALMVSAVTWSVAIFILFCIQQLHGKV